MKLYHIVSGHSLAIALTDATTHTGVTVINADAISVQSGRDAVLTESTLTMQDIDRK